MNDDRSALTWSYLMLKEKQSWFSPVLRCETSQQKSHKPNKLEQRLVSFFLLSWQTGKTETMILKEGTKQLFPVWFSILAGVWSFKPFLSWNSFTHASPIPMSLVSTSVTFCTCLKHWHMKLRDMEHLSRKALETLWEWKKSTEPVNSYFMTQSSDHQ